MSKYNLIDIYEQYQIGSGWTTDFDYDGMLKAGLKAGVDTDIEVLKKMAEDYTDVNYHREASHLYNAIEALEEGAIKEASMFFGDFHAEIKQTIKDQGMDIEPTVGQFMASKMEEDKDKDKEPRDGVKSAAAKLGMKPSHVKEVTSREGARIEGLLSIPLKSKFLEAFQDLYFDLVEEDPFMAEDVVDHLGIEMLKHLDAIQAQGDSLAGLDQQEFTAIDEEETVTEDKMIDTAAKMIKDRILKDVPMDIIMDFVKTHLQDIRKMSNSEIKDEFEEFRSVNYDYIDENLKTHFNRFK